MLLQSGQNVNSVKTMANGGNRYYDTLRTAIIIIFKHKIKQKKNDLAKKFRKWQAKL